MRSISANQFSCFGSIKKILSVVAANLQKERRKIGSTTNVYIDCYTLNGTDFNFFCYNNICRGRATAIIKRENK